MAKPRATPSRKKPAPGGHGSSHAATKRIEAGKVAAPDETRETALAIGKLALDKKALDVVVVDVRGLASYADYFVVMTAESDPQMHAIADHVRLEMKERGKRTLGVEGLTSGQWVLLDFGDVVAHVFYQDMRQFYDIEGLWADAPRLRVEG